MVAAVEDDNVITFINENSSLCSMEPTNNAVPKHVAIILDGNRRFARRLMAKPWKGHEWGAEKVEKLLHWCKEMDIRELTLYSFSIQNFDRPKEEFEYLMNIFRTYLKKLIKGPKTEKESIAALEIKVNFLGRLSLFPQDIQDLMYEVMEKTKNNKGYILNLAVAYGGREEVLEATYKLAKKVQDGEITPRDINEEVFEKELYTPSEPDLVIRTGGENRTSNFFIWQANYAEWIFYEKKLWPEFEKEDFVACIEEYKNRQRRFGK